MDHASPTPLASLYPAHLARVRASADAALAAAGKDHLVLPSGKVRYAFQDDRPLPFRANPNFLHWLPLTDLPDSWLVHTPGRRPLLVYCQPDDYWHLPPAPPHGYWLEHVDVVVVREPGEAARHLPPAARCAIVGDPEWGLDDHVPGNPQALLDRLHWDRACKSAYELEAMRMANRRAVRGHLAARQAFRDGRSERQIHAAYLEATGHGEADLPYGSIVALNAHAAVLHYQHQRHDLPDAHRSFLIDAGAEVAGYASDITRTWHDGDPPFADLVAAVDGVQQALCAQVRPGLDYRVLHLDAHLRLAGVLEDLGIVRMPAAEQVASGVGSVFFPHGIGHLIGLQVHDVGGFLAGPDGGRIGRPEGHPFLRLTRPLLADMVVTIEPGIYFIPMLLEGLRAGPHAGRVDWSLVERLLPRGGVRIEDDVRAAADGPENLSRDAFAEAGG